MANKVISLAQEWVGKKESDGTHKEIIDIYNSHKPLARGYAVKYTDSWCATFVSAVAIKLGYFDIIPTECSCQKMIELFKKIGCWRENEDYTPKPGDIIFYDWQDDGKISARVLARQFGRHVPEIEARYPRQCKAIEDCIRRLSELEKANCSNPDEPASCFGELMGQLLTYEEDLWAPTLRQMGFYLGRFIYLLDGALDYEKDEKKGKYNPYLAMGTGKDWARWEEYLVLTMGRCTDFFEKLPLVQDKPLLDNILYSGVWMNKRKKGQKEDHNV